jgi:hypothetical protein
MEAIIELISAKDLPATVILAIVLLYLFRVHREDQASARDDHKSIVNQMFDVIDRNTEAKTKVAEAMRDLKSEIRAKKDA